MACRALGLAYGWRREVTKRKPTSMVGVMQSLPTTEELLMKPISITANLYSGFVCSDPWSPTMDGILAYWHMREKLGPDQFSINQGHDYQMEPVDDLPLQMERHGEHWWYAASSPIYKAHATVQRHLHRRFDQSSAEKYLPPGTTKIQTKAGAYKNARMVANQIVTNRVTWHVIGDIEEIKRLLAKCNHIGGRVGAGFGRVRAWEYADGDAHIAQTIRPLPIEYAQQMGVEGMQMLWGYRPPGRIEANCTECIMPVPDAPMK